MLAAFLLPIALQTAPAIPIAGAPASACLSAPDTRTAIQRHKLADPMATLREAGRKQKADPLRSRLCRWGEKFVYEIALLRRDGKVIRVFVDAADGLEVSVQR
ncbi:MAG: hypothetical protein JWN93_242 [Hyphomicrobiales bacterium]|nr:hypothetical protein [Hyphomicrobiales bacterium]